MSRHGYNEDCVKSFEYERYRAVVHRAISGKRGQKFLRELAAALDALPQKRLVSGHLDDDRYGLVDDSGEVCALGAACRARGIDPAEIDATDHEHIGSLLDIAPSLVAEIEFENDDGISLGPRTPEQRWRWVRRWVGDNTRSGP